VPVPAPAPQPIATEPPKGRIRQAGARLLDSAIDTALQGLWLSVYIAVGGVALTAAVAIILYSRAPESAWIYTLIKYALAYTGGMLTLLLILAGFALIGVRRQKLIEKKNSARFKSAEKGYLDHWLHFDESGKQFQSVLAEIGTQMGLMGNCASKIGGKLATAGNNPKRAHRIVTEGAKKLDEYAAKMERSIETLKEVTDLLLESTMAVTANAPPASQGNKEPLEASREACVELLSKAGDARESIETFKGSAMSVIGMSQDTNSAMNRIIYGLESIIGLLSRAEQKWKEIVVILNRKLAS